MDLLASPSRLAMRRRRAILREGPADALGLTGLAEALDPVLHRRDADPAIARRFAARHPPIKTQTDQLDALPTRQPLTLVEHPG